MSPRFVLLAGLTCALAACPAPQEVECAAGTVREGNACVAPVLRCGDGVVLVDGLCVIPGSEQTCTPDCTGRVCGDDGCGGTCGACEGTATCTAAGQCLSDGGCVPECAGRACGNDGCGGSCGTCSDPASPICDDEGQCVSECIPDCLGGRECGADGCGGTCGACLGLTTCDARGRCVPDGWTCDASRYGDLRACDCGCGLTDPDCAEGLPVLGCEAGERCSATSTCESGVPSAWTCAPAFYGDRIRCDCGCGAPDPDCELEVPQVGCAVGARCRPDGSCGTCVPRCDGRTCGDDGCGGSCGTCSDANRPVCLSGACVNPCTPTPLQCLFAQCGDDLCGGTCGTCGAGFRCELGQCIEEIADDAESCRLRCGTYAPSGCSCASDCAASGTCCPDFEQRCVCTPRCDGRTCGSDGCGGSCGTCDASAPHCTAAGTCTNECTPSCGDDECGDDGCGGTCGTCANGALCSVNGRCVPPDWTCARYAYADGSTCDCGCGAIDPDCADATNPILGCPSGVACAAGTCQMTACTRDGECTTGRWCLGVYRTAAATWGGRCGPPIAFAEPPGASCEVAEDCATLACLDGLCRRHCGTDADCVSGQVCLGLAVPLQPERRLLGHVAACDRPPGAATPCDRQAACLRTEVCAPFVDPVTSGPRFLCTLPGASGAATGASCEAGPCADGLFCVGPAGSRTCAKACPGGVTDCTSGWSCRELTFHDRGTPSTSDDPKVPVCAP